MIDRLLLSLSRAYLDDEIYEYLMSRFDTVNRVSTDGQLVWEKPLTAKTRSDDPDVNFRFTVKGIQIWGSPAMVDNLNNVFGSMDIKECAQKLIKRASKGLGVIFPDYTHWELHGLDITHSIYMDTPNDVLTALNVLGKMSDGRLKTVRYPEAVYFGMKSQTRTLKVYSKGAHIDKQAKKKDVGLSDWEKKVTFNLLRIECVLKKKWLERYLLNPDAASIERHATRRTRLNDDVKDLYNLDLRKKRWYDMDENELNVIYTDFWEHIAGNGVDVPSHEQDLEKRIIETAEEHGYSEGLALAAFKTWTVIKAVGKSQAQYMSSKATWHRHLKILKLAGLTSGDFSEATVLKTRITKLDLSNKVESYDDINKIINKKT